MRRFVIEPGAVAEGRVRFARAEAHHLARVLRLRAGAVVEAADGQGRLYQVRLERVGAGEAWGRVIDEDRPAPGTPAARESPCAITLGQAILKGDRMAWLVQKATELGVARILPLETARVVARPRPDGVARRARWERVAREAVKQCGRARVPAVEPPCRLAAALAEVPAHDAAWLCLQEGGAPVAVLARRAGRPRRLLLLVGPEGGFTAAEVAAAQAAGAEPASLGPRTLRAESAGLAALALAQHLFGDLGSAG